MTTYLAHAVVMNLLPALIGLAAGQVFGGRVRRLSSHASVCLITGLTSIVLQYFAYLVVLGWTTGSWPDSLPVGGVLYGLAWFSIPAVFTTFPMTVAGYLLSVVLQRRSLNEPRTPEILG